jgi:hypothetical protein
MSDEQAKRETIVALSGSAEEGNAWLLAAWLDFRIEITVTEEKGGDSSVVLSRAQAIHLARLLMAALDPPPTIFKCRECDAPATCQVTEVNSDKGETKILRLCEQHARQLCDQANRKPQNA